MLFESGAERFHPSAKGAGPGFLSGLFAHEFFDQHIEKGRKDENQDRGGHHSAQDAGADGVLGARPGAGADRQRQDAEAEGQGSHHDRPEAQFGPLQCGVDQIHPSFQSVLGELDDQDGVLRGQAQRGQ